jgi:hypothetical protein
MENRFAKNGLVYGCYSGLEVDYCSSTAVIKNDLTIYLADTLKTTEANSKIFTFDSTIEYCCMYKDGKIKKDGKIIINRERTKDLK